MLQDVLNYLEKQIVKDEGERLRLYTDTKGKVTIGRGRNLTDRGITRDEMELMYRNDVALIMTNLDQYLPFWSALSEPRQYVLMNMCFMGIGKLLEFRKMIAALKVGNWEEAANQILDSKYHADVGARAERLAEIMRTDNYL